MMKQFLLKKIKEKSISVGVVGLGYVGLPLAVEKAKAGFKTIGFDVQSVKVEMVNAGHNYIGDVVDSDLASLVKSGMLSATNDFSFIKDVDFVAICVPTPLDEHQHRADVDQGRPQGAGAEDAEALQEADQAEGAAHDHPAGDAHGHGRHGHRDHVEGNAQTHGHRDIDIGQDDQQRDHHGQQGHTGNFGASCVL